MGTRKDQVSDTISPGPSKMGSSFDIATVLEALLYAANKHSGQRRKKDGAPYINHPIAVAEILARVGRVTDPVVLKAAFLHDVLEDTDTSGHEMASLFGPGVLSIVQEVSDDMSLPKPERKRRQVETAGTLSPAAKLIRIADKICNVRDITPTEPADWSLERKRAYLDWAEEVVRQCQGSHSDLEALFTEVLQTQRSKLRSGS